MFAGFQIEAERVEIITAVVIQILRRPLRSFNRRRTNFVAGHIEDRTDFFNVLPDTGERQVSRFNERNLAVDVDFAFNVRALTFDGEVLEVDLVHSRFRNRHFVGNKGRIVLDQFKVTFVAGIAGSGFFLFNGHLRNKKDILQAFILGEHFQVHIRVDVVGSRNDDRLALILRLVGVLAFIPAIRAFFEVVRGKRFVD